jgi:hypothetical protein
MNTAREYIDSLRNLPTVERSTRGLHRAAMIVLDAQIRQLRAGAGL